ncbi:MAG: glycosyltransferase family 2 protein [Chloroflexota bacterium]
MSKALSLVIPTYNERDNIVPLVEAIHGTLAGREYEIIFVDDDSRDGTAEAVHGLEPRFPVRLVVRKDKKGLASAVVDGIGYADSDIVGVMDADLQHPPEVILGLLRALEDGTQVAIASRYVKGGGTADWGLARKIISWGAVLLAHLFLPETRAVYDPMSGFFMFRKEVVDGVALKPTGYKILLEILVKGKYRKLTEVPYRFVSRERGSSKLGTKQQLDYLRHVFSLMNRRQELSRFAKFCLVGGSGVLVNMGLLLLLTEFVGFYYLLSSAIGIETSIISNFLLNDFFTFRDRRAQSAQNLVGRLFKFNLVSLAGLGINLALLWFLTSVVGMYYLISNLFGIAAATLWNYLVNVLWTWR